jgi:hypothetical protein
MHRSFASGRPEGIDKVRTIADSGQRVGVIVCGSNIDPAGFAAQTVIG